MSTNLVTLKDLESAKLGDRVTIWRRRKASIFPEPDINLGTDERPQWRWYPETIQNYLTSRRRGGIE